MKTKMLVLAALVSAAAVSANAGVHWNISIGLPLPVFVPRMVAAPCPPPCPAPPVVVETVPACPSVDYVVVGGGYYCPSRPAGYAWAGSSYYRPAGYAWAHGEHQHFNGGYRR